MTLVPCGQPMAPDAAQRHFGFSDRQMEILELAALGYSNQEIATYLFIDPDAVKVHLRGTFRSIGVFRRSEAVTWVWAHVDMGLES